MAVTGDTPTFVTAAGPRATRTVPNVDAIEPELVGFVRSAVRWLDPGFPQKGTRGERVKGGWKDDQQVETEFTQVEEVTSDGRGIRILRLYRMTEPGPPWEGAIRVIALGAANGARLEVRWNFIANESGIRGTSAELTAEGPRHHECVADFQSWFATPGN
ncbi:MAG: hypothetical protein H0T46_12430 [Deltaproteobacteria bacterium]|nr:hypothetical protein [Deltaproteobacteria bacterium]